VIQRKWKMAKVKLKYSYDVDLYALKSGKKIKTVHKGISGEKLKAFRKSIKSEMADNREFRIYKNTTHPTGNTSRRLHDRASFGLQDNIKRAIGNYDFHYIVEVDCEYDNRCVPGCDGEYCGCSRIERAEVESVDIDYVSSCLSKEVLRAIKPFKLEIDREILEYCLDRFFRHSGLRDRHNYYVQTCSGYYGEEIDKVIYEGGELVYPVSDMVHGSSLNALRFVLEEEYGYLLDFLKSAEDCRIFDGVSFDDIEVPNADHYVRLDKNLVEKYKDYGLPIGVYRESGWKYRLIDGYHRLKAALAADKKTFKVIVVK